MITHAHRLSCSSAGSLGSDVGSFSLPTTMKIILIGDPCVGKTTVFRRYSSPDLERTLTEKRRSPVTSRSNGHLSKSDMAFLDVYSEKVVSSKDQGSVLLQIHDTAGQERYRSLTQSYFRGADACLIFYDTSSEETFMNVTNWYKDLTTYCNAEDLVVMIVGTRLSSQERQVTRERAEKLAEWLGVSCMEIDKDSDVNVDLMFHTLVEQFLTQTPHRRLSQIKRRQSMPAVISLGQDRVVRRCCCS